MRDDALMIKGYMAGYMNKEAAGATPMLQAPQAAVPATAGMGMGAGMPAAGAGFPANPEMVVNEEEAAERQQEAEREQNLTEMGTELSDLKYESKEQKLTGDIYKEKMKLVKQEQAMKEQLAAEQNDASLGNMLGKTSPGE